MSRYHLDAHFSSEFAGTVQEGQVELVRHDRDGSVGSEASSSYNPYPHIHKDDDDIIEDPHLALTSQTLNADGTPKRPMNAFMIFARKRRPQISAANQMMRTGDVSKILSKEWNTMEMSEKKFYLDQAKKLKDNFNSKYPDYVYRRRPNNSRKKRKPDSEHESPIDAAHAAETEDASLEETSPIESDDPAISPTSPELPYPRAQGVHASATYQGHDAFVPSQSSCTYSYPSDFSTGQFGQPSRFPQYSSPTDSTLPTPISPLRPAPDSIPVSQGYQSHSLYHSQPQPSSYPPQGSHTGNAWEPTRSSARSDQARSWSALPTLDTNFVRQRPASSLVMRSDAYSPQVPNRSWSATTSSTTSSSSGSTYNSGFPTLTSSFVPKESPSQKSADVAPSPTSQPGSAQEYFHPSSAQFQRMSSSGRQDGAQPQSDYAHSSIPPQPMGPSYGSPLQNASQWPQQYPRASSSHTQRLSNIFPLSSPSGEGAPRPSAGASQSHMYWDRYDGR